MANVVHMFDHLPPEEAIRRAWLIEGANPLYHRRMQNVVRESMPLLARALDRMEKSPK